MMMMKYRLAASLSRCPVYKNWSAARRRWDRTRVSPGERGIRAEQMMYFLPSPMAMMMMMMMRDQLLPPREASAEIASQPDVITRLPLIPRLGRRLRPGAEWNGFGGAASDPLLASEAEKPREKCSERHEFQRT